MMKTLWKVTVYSPSSQVAEAKKRVHVRPGFSAH